jgi:hypothetical protein
MAGILNQTTNSLSDHLLTALRPQTQAPSTEAFNQMLLNQPQALAANPVTGQLTQQLQVAKSEQELLKNLLALGQMLGQAPAKQTKVK